MGVNPHLAQVLKVGNSSLVDVMYPLKYSDDKGITALYLSPCPGTHDVRRHQTSPKKQATESLALPFKTAKVTKSKRRRTCPGAEETKGVR